jgi:hypothetical protein
MSGAEDAPGGSARSAREGVVRDARALATDLEALLDETRTSLTDALERHPYLTLGAAAAAGYVLAGGLASRLTALALGAGARIATASLLGRFAAGPGGLTDLRRNRHGSRSRASERFQ